MSPSVPEVVIGLPDTDSPVGVVRATEVTVPEPPEPPPVIQGCPVDVAKHVATIPVVNVEVAPVSVIAPPMLRLFVIPREVDVALARVVLPATVNVPVAVIFVAVKLPPK